MTSQIDERTVSLSAGAWKWLFLSLAVAAADQYTKYLIMQNLIEFERMVLLPVLEFMRLHNEGAAFSFLSGAGGWQRWLFIGIGLAVGTGIVIWIVRLPAKGRGLLAAGLAFVLGGAIGNVTDRILWGHVVDFIRVHYQDWYFPAFNVADSSISIGVALLLLDSLLDWRRSKA